MDAEPKLITCVVPTDEDHPAWQARAAAVAEALGEGLVLVGNPTVTYRRHRRRRFMVCTWETAPAPPDLTESGWIPLPG